MVGSWGRVWVAGVAVVAAAVLGVGGAAGSAVAVGDSGGAVRGLEHPPPGMHDGESQILPVAQFAA